jgi:hypothetical protein
MMISIGSSESREPPPIDQQTRAEPVGASQRRRRRLSHTLSRTSYSRPLLLPAVGWLRPWPSGRIQPSRRARSARPLAEHQQPNANQCVAGRWRRRPINQSASGPGSCPLCASLNRLVCGTPTLSWRRPAVRSAKCDQRVTRLASLRAQQRRHLGEVAQHTRTHTRMR